MTREMKYAKCVAVLSKILRMGAISEAEFKKAKSRIMDDNLIARKFDRNIA